MTTRAVALVSYNSPDVIPASLRPVAWVTASAPDSVMRVTGTFYSSVTTAPVTMPCLGAVNYANISLVPARLIPMAKE